MTSSSSVSLKRKDYFNLKEIHSLYKMITKYNLRETAYVKLLEFYISSKNDSGLQEKKIKSL